MHLIEAQVDSPKREQDLYLMLFAACSGGV
jgi:hypothetical protein